MRKNLMKLLTALCAAVFFLACALLSLGGSSVVSASAFDYRSAANGISSSYASGKYYQHLQQVTLTGDGVTDTLSVAISQLGYQESGSVYSLAGTTSGSSGDYTEYNYNMGSINGYAYYWCATFVAWSLYQGGATNQNTQSAWCRFHMGDINYIWREVSCSYWANQLKNFSGYFKYSAYNGGSYTPKAGDLIFFRSDISHIGIVRYSAGGYVYTIEGNTTDASGVESNGGGVYLKSYSLSSSSIYGYGCLPYASNASAPKIDWTGANPTEGQYITNAATAVSSTAGGATAFTIPRFSTFSVTGFSGGYAIVNYNGSTGYASLANSLQFTSTGINCMSAEESDTYYPGNAQNIGFPADNHPNIKLTGLSIPGVKCYWGLEDYGDNANLILINGKTVAQWQAEKPLSVARAWIFGNGNNCTCWFGFHLDDVNALRLDTQAGTGEVLQTITLKKGLKILQTAQDIWGSDNVITETSGNVTGIAGTVEYDITLTAKSGGGFSVAVAEPETKTYVEVTGDGVNVRSEPSAEQGTATVLGVANQGEQYEYLGEQTGAWYKILYQGQTAYITSDYSKLVEVEVGTGDSGNTDGGDTDSGNTDSGNTDSGNTDSGNTDSGNTDSGNTDSGNTDSGNTDSGNTDSGNTDSGNTDSGNTDGGNTGDVDNVGGDVGNNNGNEDVPTTNGGCGGSMGGMALGVLVFAGAALLLKKRKQN